MLHFFLAPSSSSIYLLKNSVLPSCIRFILCYAALRSVLCCVDLTVKLINNAFEAIFLPPALFWLRLFIHSSLPWLNFIVFIYIVCVCAGRMYWSFLMCVCVCVRKQANEWARASISFSSYTVIIIWFVYESTLQWRTNQLYLNANMSFDSISFVLNPFTNISLGIENILFKNNHFWLIFVLSLEIDFEFRKIFGGNL